MKQKGHASELAFFAACLQNPKDAGMLLGRVKDEWFSAANLPLLKAMKELHRKGFDFNDILIEDVVLHASKTGPEFHVQDLDAIRDMFVLPHAAIKHIDTIKEEAVLRYRKTIGKAIEGAKDLNEINELLSKARKFIDGATIRTATHISQVLDDVHDQVVAAMKRGHGESTGIYTGYDTLDDLLSGYRPGTLNLLAARPSMGKTSFAQNILVRLARHVPVVFFSKETSNQSIASKQVGIHSGLPTKDIRHGNMSDSDYNRYLKAKDSLKKMPIFLEDSTKSKIGEIEATCRELKSNENIGAVIIDYLQLLQPDDRKMRGEEAVADISQRLKALSLELSIPFLVLSQLNRECEKRKDPRPMLSDLRGSGSLEQDADTVAFLFREEYYRLQKGQYVQEEIKGVTELILEKNRDGSPGVVMYKFLPKIGEFYELGSKAFGDYEDEGR